MSADIVERLEAVARNPYNTIRDMPGLESTAKEAAAEIGRLRVEVEALLEDPDEAELAYRCGDPDSDAIAPAEAKGDFCPRCRGTGETCTGTIDGTPELFDCRDCLGSGLFTAPVGATIADAAGDQSLTLDAARELLRAVAHAIKLGRYNAPQPAGGEAVAPGRCAECRHTTFERRHDGSHICAHCKAVYAALRAADNRDAAGVERQPDGYMAQWAADQLRSNKYVSCHLYNHQNKVIHGDGKEAVPFYFWPPAPAAVPAGETNGDAPADVLEHLIFSVDRVANSGDYGLCDQAVVQLNYAIEDARRGIGTGTPQPADGEAVAEWQVWHEQDGWGATHPDNVAEYRARGVPVRPLYAHPPAPVQAAQQEGAPRWVDDCQGKASYDGALVSVSVRTWPGNYSADNRPSGKIDVLRLGKVVQSIEVSADTETQLRAEIESKVAKLAEGDKRDAARYRWLRDLPDGSPYECIGNMPGDRWDDEIDAGMKEQP